MKTTHTVLLAAGLVAGLALASSETFAAGPMIAPGALATTAVGSAEASVEKTVVVVRRRAVVRNLLSADMLWCAGASCANGLCRLVLCGSISTDRCVARGHLLDTGGLPARLRLSA